MLEALTEVPVVIKERKATLRYMVVSQELFVYDFE